MAISRPTRRWCWPGRSSRTRWLWPRRSPPRWPAASCASADYRGGGFTVAAAKPGFHQHPARSRGLARAAARDPARRHGLWRFARSAAASGSMSSSSRPTRPGRCMSGTAAARWSATRWPALLAKAGFAVQREYYINDAGAQVDVLARSTASALPRGAGRDDRTRSPRACIPANTCRDRPRAGRARRRQMARPARGGMAGADPRVCRRAR